MVVPSKMNLIELQNESTQKNRQWCIEVIVKNHVIIYDNYVEKMKHFLPRLTDPTYAVNVTGGLQQVADLHAIVFKTRVIFLIAYSATARIFR